MISKYFCYIQKFIVDHENMHTINNNLVIGSGST